MREKAQLGLGVIERVQHEAELDLVVPFTTPELTRAALDAANRMGAGLNATLRLVKVQVVPFPLDLDQSPVYIDFLKDQMAQFESDLPVAGEIRLAREFEAGLLATLGRESVVILATPKRPWRTRNEHLAATLRRAGHKVVLVTQGANNA
jgi:hypothetical protein